jgi:hypothetical protein
MIAVPLIALSTDSSVPWYRVILLYTVGAVYVNQYFSNRKKRKAESNKQAPD